MNLISENLTGLSMFESSSIDSKELSKDILVIIEKLVGNHSNSLIGPFNSIMIFIDATNGCIFCSGFDKRSFEIMDDIGCNLDLYELWEMAGDKEEGALYFDNIVSQCIVDACKTEYGKQLKSSYGIYYQNELDDIKLV